MMRARSLSDIAVRDEAKEVRPDARPQAWENRRCIRWNTEYSEDFFRAEHDADGLRSFAAVERSTSDRLLSPGPVDFADVLHPAHGANFPPDIVRNRDHPQLCAMAIGSPTEFLHDLG